MVPKKTAHTLEHRLINFLASRRFFLGALGLFVVGAAWIALASRYPMPADEDFHFGLIKLYSRHLSPFWSVQPVEGNVFGALIRDPSYLYHYIFGLVYHPVSFLIRSEMWQVIVLRLCNLGLFSAGVIIFHNTFARARLVSRAGLNVVFAITLLVPMVSQVAGQINYDNLLFLILALLLRLVISIVHNLRHQKFLAKQTVALLLLMLLGSLVKFTLLPITAAITLFLGWTVKQTLGFKQACNLIWSNFRTLSRAWQILLIAAVLLASGLWLERYGVNTIRYHSPTPACNRVIGDQGCLSYGPWRRNYYFKLEKSPQLNTNIVHYSKHWANHIVWSLLYVLNGPFSSYAVAGPYWVLFTTSRILLIGGIMVIVASLRRLWHEPVLRLLILIIVFYVGALFARNYTEFRDVGQPVAIQGRYLIPMIIPLGLLALAAVEMWFRSLRPKAAITVVILLLLLQGGGSLSYIALTNQDWYWQYPQFQAINTTMRRVVKPLIYERLSVEP